MDKAVPVPDFTNLAGPYILAHMLSFSLFGVLCVQLYIYSTAFKSDPTWLKILVYAIFVLEITFQCLEIYVGYWTLGSGWGHVDHLLGFPPQVAAFTMLTGIITSLGHAFYSWRIVVLAKNYAILTTIAVFSLVQLCMTIYISVLFGDHSKEPTVETANRSTIGVTIWLTFSAAADMVITIVMSGILLDARRKTQYLPTANHLQLLIKYTVETGFVTSFAVIADLILFRAIPNTNYHFIVYFSIDKIYANTLLATLNSRIPLAPSTDQVVKSDSVLQFRSPNYLWDNSQTRPSQSISSGGVPAVTKTTLVLNDNESFELPTKPIESAADDTSSAPVDKSSQVPVRTPREQD